MTAVELLLDKFGTTCRRCGGLYTLQHFYEVALDQQSSGVMLRCVNCGDRVDHVIAGHRECRYLQNQMGDEEKRAVELDENTERLNLVDYEMSKQRLAEIRQVEASLREKDLRSHRDRKSSRGRPEKAGSQRATAKESGTPKTTRVKLEHHVALAEQFPFMQQPGWTQTSDHAPLAS